MMDVTLNVDHDTRRGLLRVSRQTLNAMGITPGDTVLIESKARAYGRVMPAAVSDGTAQIDAWLAQNAGAEDHSTATLRPISLPALDAIVLKVEGAHASDRDQLKERFYDMALSVGDNLPLDGGAKVEVVDLSPENAGVLTDKTVVTLDSPADKSLGYKGLGGLEQEVSQVHELIAAPLLRPELFEHLGLSAPRGVLFSGPPGSGKTLLARSVAERTKASFFHVNAPEIVTKHYGESEAALRKTFEAASKASPAIIFIDEIDAIAPQRAGLSDEKQVERRIVAQLLTLMDGLSDRGRIVVMAATNLPDALDPALRRPGRFDREIRFQVPTEAGRRDILGVHLSQTPLASDVNLDTIARQTHGYVGADLAALAREAAVAALSRAVREAGGEQHVQLSALKVQQTDLLMGFDATSPSALRSDEAPPFSDTLDTIGGLEEVKDKLKTAVMLPLQQPQLFEQFGVSPPRGILLAGPPGTGKTMLARALANEAQMNFIPVRAPRLLSQFLGEAERAITELFTRARNSRPTLLFFDEFDSIAPRRGADAGVVDRIIAQLLVELDGLSDNKNLVVLAATNRPSAIDPALIRPGRFDLIVDVPLPDLNERTAILDIHMRDRPFEEGMDAGTLAKDTAGFSGADLANLVNSAATKALQQALKTGKPAKITQQDFATVLSAKSKADKARSMDHITSENSQ